MNLTPYEKKVYSQAGDDGVIEKIFKTIGTTNKVCVEFGERGTKGNTKLLRADHGWRATMFDANPVTPDSHKAFISAENIMSLFTQYNIPEFDLLSIDIDGNDYWVWAAIDESKFKARVVIVEEYNANFPLGDSRTIAYNPVHRYDKTIYYGASLTALQRLGKSKGTTCYITGFLNLFFVADDLMPKLKSVKSVFPYPLDVPATAARWGDGPPTWFDQESNRPRPDHLDRPWVTVPAKNPPRVAVKSRWDGAWHPVIHPSKKNKTMLIIGNGPSAKELVDYGFENIPDTVDTFGMGAAYRYYECIHWWPKYYAWFDRKCVTSHWSAFKRIIEDTDIPIEHFWFSRGISKSERFTVSKHHSTGDRIFEMALEMGYKTILLVGLDCSYVEQIPEAEQLHMVDPARDAEFRANIQMPIPENHLFIITQTPAVNPNYFFSWYQQEGDIFSKPNASASHTKAWLALEKKYSNSADVRVVNCGPSSTLNFNRGSLARELNDAAE